MDGNRRFAKRLMLKPWMGHEWGAEKLRKVLEWCRNAGVEEVTLYAFSIQNFDRPKKEFDYLMKLFIREAKALLSNEEFLSNEHGVRVNFIGRLWMFPAELVELMRRIMKHTERNEKYVVNVAVAYGGREEIIDAARKVSEKVLRGELTLEELNEEAFSKELYLRDEPDMVIRTGGEVRTSNFLPWQSSYSEWFFLEKMWPEFEEEDFLQCLAEYANRERRFGR